MAEQNTKTKPTAQDAQRPVERLVMRKVHWYFSDRWERVINIYQCPKCGKDESDLNKTKPQIERDHVCV